YRSALRLASANQLLFRLQLSNRPSRLDFERVISVTCLRSTSYRSFTAARQFRRDRSLTLQSWIPKDRRRSYSSSPLSQARRLQLRLGFSPSRLPCSAPGTRFASSIRQSLLAFSSVYWRSWRMRSASPFLS